MTTTKQYLAWLRKQVDYRETPVNLTKFAAMAGHRNGWAWCATFAVAGAKETHLALPPGADTASCALNESAYKRARRLSTTPRVGAHGFVFFPSLGRPAHQVTVWKVSADGRWVWTVEGNSNDDGSRDGYEVCLRKRLAHRVIGTTGIRSYGMPLYDNPPSAQEADVTLSKEDRALIARDVADELMHRFLTQRIVPNPAVTRGEPDAPDSTLIGCWSNTETNIDEDRKRYLIPIRDAVVPESGK